MILRLGFHYHIPALQRAGRIWTSRVQGCFLDALASHFAELVCFLHEPRDVSAPETDYPLQSGNIRFVPLPIHASVPRRLLDSGSARAALLHELPRLNALLFRTPTPLLPILATATARIPTPVLVVGDAEACVQDSPQPAWRKLLLRLFWRWNTNALHRVARSNLVLVNSPELHRQLKAKAPHLAEVRTSTIHEADLLLPSSPSTHRQNRILFVGRMTRGKGVLDILQAGALLHRRGIAAELRFVGPVEAGDLSADEFNAAAAQMGISRFVHSVGTLGSQETLFREYRDAAVFVTAARSSEGIPRTIWEAMACRTPVIATAVGGIPAAVPDAALLCPPRNPAALADAMASVLLSPDIRSRLVESGSLLAQEMTLERQVAKMATLIKEYCTACAGQSPGIGSRSPQGSLAGNTPRPFPLPR